MKVLQFFPSINIGDGGTTTYIKELAPALGALVELHVCVLGKRQDCVPLDNATIHCIEGRLTHICRMKKQWMAVLEEVKPDIVHVNCCWMPQCTMVQYWTREWRRSTVFLTPHGMLEPWIIRRNYWTKKVPAILLYQKWAVKNADVVVATAEEEKRHIEELSWNKNVEMLPNGINSAAIKMKTQWKDAKDLLFMSRLHPKKGLEMLIEAMKSVQSLTLKIAGDGEPEYVESLKNLVKENHLEERIAFTGPIYGERKWEMIREADVVVLPSYSENFGLIVAEALASGTPVLTTTGTPWGTLREYKCGWWIDPNVQEISNVLKLIEVTDANVLKTMGTNGKMLVNEKYDVKALANSLLITYSKNIKIVN